MSLRAVCPHCHKAYTVGEELRGRKVRCKGCQETFLVRGAAPPDEGPVRRRKARRPPSPKGLPMPWIVAGVLAGVVLLAAVIGGLVWGFRGRNPAPAPAADHQPPVAPAQDGSDMLAEALAELDRAEPGWRLADLQRQRPAIPDRENSALQVLAAKKLLPADWRSWPVEPNERDPDRVAALRQAFEDGLNTHPLTEELTPTQANALRAELRRASAALAEARKLADMPRGRFPIDWSGDLLDVIGKLPLQDAREITRLLEYDLLLRAQDRDLSGAVVSWRAALNTGRSIGDEHTLFAQLVRVACRIGARTRIERLLNQGELSEEALSTVQALLEEEAEQPLLRYAMPGERAYQDWYVQAVQEGRKMPDGGNVLSMFGVDDATFQEAQKDYHPSMIRRTRAAHLRLSSKCVEIARLPIDEQRPHIETLARTVKELPKVPQISWIVFEKIAQVCRRNATEMRCAAVAVALERYRQKHQRWPTGLSELVPDFLQQVPLDALDGKPLRYRPLSDGVVVYSVGQDGADDGGNLDRDFTKPGTDFGLRLWDVPLRRQPRP